MKRGVFHWETLAKLIIMVIILLIIIFLVVSFKDRMYDIMEKLRENF